MTSELRKVLKYDKNYVKGEFVLVFTVFCDYMCHVDLF